jgi:hypothetical protein
LGAAEGAGERSGRSYAGQCSCDIKTTNVISVFRGSETPSEKGATFVEQPNLLIRAMAERCQRIIQDKPGDTRFGLPEPLCPKHLRWMCKEIVEHAEDWPAVKLQRWIGFIQAGMIANFMLNLEGVKAMFNSVKEQYGSVADDQDLLDHLDPSSSFEMEIGGQG